MRVAGARADFGYVEPAPPPGDRLYYRAGNLPRLIRQTRERLTRLTAEARALGLQIEGDA